MTGKLIDWFDLSYLATGNRIQRAAYHTLTQIRIMKHLRAHHPVLVGTIPIELHIEGSDLDIICEVHEFDAFVALCKANFASYPDFAVHHTTAQELATCVIGFTADDFHIEIFAQPRPVKQQNAYRHMVIEYRLLQMSGEKAHTAIRRLKCDGLKTEPAFARYFKIEGNPYDMLLELAELDDTALMQWLNHHTDESNSTL